MSGELVRAEDAAFADLVTTLSECEHDIESAIRRADSAVRAYMDAGDRAERVKRASALIVGSRLWMIQARKLYKETHRSFEKYLDERWGYSESHGYRLIGAAKTMKSLPQSEMGEEIAPTNERQARALLSVPEADRPRVMEKAAETGKVTARAIAEAALSLDSDKYTVVEAGVVLDEELIWQVKSAAINAYEGGWTLPDIQTAVASAIAAYEGGKQ